MHSIIHIAKCGNQPPNSNKNGPKKIALPVRSSVDKSAVEEGTYREDSSGGVSIALLGRGMNLERAVVALAQAMDTHLGVASLQWICLVCLTDLHALDVRVSDFFMVHAGCQILHR